MRNIICELNFAFDQFSFAQDLASEVGWEEAFAGEGEGYSLKQPSACAEVTRIVQALSSLGDVHSWIIKVPPGKKIRWHMDHNKEASVVFPLSQDMSVQFLQGESIFEFFS